MSAPTTMYKSFAIRQEGDVQVLDLLTEQLSELAPERNFESELRKYNETNQPSQLLVNFSQVSFAGSDGIGVLIRCRRHVARAGGQMKLCCMNAHIRQAFQILNLDSTLFEIYDDEPSALASFK